MTYLRQLWAYWLYRRALAKYEMARHYRKIAAEQAEEGAALERQSSILRMNWKQPSRP